MALGDQGTVTTVSHLFAPSPRNLNLQYKIAIVMIYDMICNIDGYLWMDDNLEYRNYTRSIHSPGIAMMCGKLNSQMVVLLCFIVGFQFVGGQCWPSAKWTVLARSLRTAAATESAKRPNAAAPCMAVESDIVLPCFLKVLVEWS